MKKIFIFLLSIGLSACMMGPDFHPQAAPQTQRYTASPLPKKTVATKGRAGKSEEFMLGKNVEKDWWEIYHSKEINCLVSEGIRHSPNIKAARATLRQAYDNYKAQFGTLLLPTITGQFSGVRERFSGEEFGDTQSRSNTLFNLFDATTSLSYTLDIWGGLRRQVEAAHANVDFERYELLAAYLAITSNIVTAAITASSLQAQIDATQALIQAFSEQLNILQKQFELGAISKANVLTQQTLVEQTKATLPPLQKSLAQTNNALAVLTGRLPSETKIPTIRLNKLFLPEELPVALPSVLVRQRPDIQASEALLHVATANIGAATANLFPQLTISAMYGFESNILSNLIQPIHNIWNYGANLGQTFFQGGALVSQRRAAIAAYQNAFQQYQQTVLTAFQNVADTLKAIEYDAKAYRANVLAETAARNNLNLIQGQYRLGGVDYLSLLNAEQQYQQTLINRIQAEAARFADTAALYQALGGGWMTCQECISQLAHKPVTNIKKS
jgi:NodT family efflux transporter outer membrane factor (OMF) lipoprotein